MNDHLSSTAPMTPAMNSEVVVVRRAVPSTMLFNQTEWQGLAQRLALSEREVQLCHGVVDNKTDAEIAEQLELSAHTVRTYFERLYRKLDVSSRAELVVRLALENRFPTQSKLKRRLHH